jgi:hypothetical protein
MTEPLFWLGLSLALVSVSLTAVLIAALPALQELGRAARSAEKLFDSLNREFPPTLEAIRLTGLEISELTDDLNQGLQGAADIIDNVDQTLNLTKQAAGQVQQNSRRFGVGLKAAWQTWRNYSSPQAIVPPSLKNRLPK